MAKDMAELIEQHHPYFEVLPYYVLLESHPLGSPPTTRRVQAGFDVDVYGDRVNSKPGITEDYSLAQSLLDDLAHTVSAHADSACSVEVIPFDDTTYFDTRRHFQPEARLRLRISHQRGLEQPLGPAEQAVLKEVKERLNALGITQRGGGG